MKIAYLTATFWLKIHSKGKCSMKVKLNGIKLPHFKEASGIQTIEMPAPSQVVIPMVQHMGAPCTPVVAVGDTVSIGQVIGDSDSYVSSPIHASVSGNIAAIKEIMLISGKPCDAVVIDNDGKQTMHEGIKPVMVNDAKELVEAIRKSGATGLGGAGFPTHVKLGFDPAKLHADILLINAAECEPYITSDHREILEASDDIIGGVNTILRLLSIERAIIAIEDNKPDAVALMRKKTVTMSNIEIVPLKSQYPQGAEKVIINSATGRVINEGELPINKGVLVLNVSTVAFINRYLKTGIPLISRRITVAGDCLESPLNLSVAIGTPISDVLKYARPIKEAKKVLMGGPMMGLCIAQLDAPVIKNNNAILFFNKFDTPKTTACIRCGRCGQACPVLLMPRALESAYDARDVAELEGLKVNLCINCGSCSYVCPAKRNLAEKHQLAKQLVTASKEAAKK